ncbi:MAG: hypothetical protein HYX32_05055 [Actinobacteria bacterium]|nr:hypothetical protein [Actinomycetota bacterium]
MSEDTGEPDVINCHTHPHERTAGTCRSCLNEFCDHCLVYSYGRSKPPYCIPCALEAAGVTAAEDSVS